MKVFIDIETIPGQNLNLRAEIAAQVHAIPPYEDPKCPRNIKKAETIRDWQENTFPLLRDAAQQKYQDDLAKRESSLEDAWRKTALHGEHGEIICIGWAVEDADPSVVSRHPLESEGALLQKFFYLVYDQLNKRNPSWVGHNVQFDLRFLFHRAVILGVKPCINLYHDSKPWSEVAQDTMMMWAGIKEKISLDRLCKVLGIATKDQDLDGEPIDGSKVWDFVQRGEIEKVATYCMGDVTRCRDVYKRMQFIDTIAHSISRTEFDQNSSDSTSAELTGNVIKTELSMSPPKQVSA
jgi:predicted PolB exonuclease-like 3'-5' exonuclease